MRNESNDKLLIELFSQLLEYWLAELSPEEIRQDHDKVVTMDDFRKALNDTEVAMPETVTQLYAKVYLRDVWGSM